MVIKGSGAYLVQHVLNQLDLVRNLCTTKNSKEGSFWTLEGFGEVLELLLHQETSGTLRELDADHTGVRSVSSSECVINVDIAELREALPESGHTGRISLDFLALLVLCRSLLLNVESEILKEDYGSRAGFVDGLLNIGTHGLVEEGDGLSDLFLKLL